MAVTNLLSALGGNGRYRLRLLGIGLQVRGFLCRLYPATTAQLIPAAFRLQVPKIPKGAVPLQRPQNAPRQRLRIVKRPFPQASGRTLVSESPSSLIRAFMCDETKNPGRCRGF